MTRLLDHYQPKIVWHARRSFAPGLDRADLESIARYGCAKGIQSWDEARGSLSTIVNTAIHRQLCTAVRQATSERQRPLNESLRMTNYQNDDPDDTLVDEIADPRPSAYDRVVQAEEHTSTLKQLRSVLSDVEQEVLDAALAGGGASFNEIAQAVGRTKKSVDNTLGRLRAKYQRLMGEVPQILASTLTVEAF